MRANFIKMISPIRFRESSVKKDPTDGRNPFDSDYSRIVLSSHFRRFTSVRRKILRQCFNY